MNGHRSFQSVLGNFQGTSLPELDEIDSDAICFIHIAPISDLFCLPNLILTAAVAYLFPLWDGAIEVAVISLNVQICNVHFACICDSFTTSNGVAHLDNYCSK